MAPALLWLAIVTLFASLTCNVYAAPAEVAQVADRQADAGGKAIIKLWLRGRYFIDVLENERFDPSADKALKGHPVRVGRVVAGSFVSLGSATTDSVGVFDFKFSGSPSGTYHIYHATLKRILVSFEWPTGSYKFGHLIPVPVPKTSTNAGPTTTKATKTGSKTKSTTRFTTTCAPVYDGTSLPWLAWSDQTNGGDNDAVILDLDVDSAGNVYFCGYSAYYLDVGTFAVDGQLNNRGFVARISPMGTVKWLQSVGQSVDQADLSEIRSCKLTPDGTKLMVAGYSAEGNLTFGTVRMPTRGNEDFFVSLMDPSTGNVLSVASIGKWGAAGDGFQALAKGASGVNMFALFQTSNDATFSDTKTNITCPSTVTRGLCCVVVKHTGLTRNWIQPVHDNYCTKGAITASADGSKVFAALKGKAYVLDGANGNFLANKTISNLTDCNGVVTIGSNLYVVGTSKGTTSVDSVSIAGPAITGNYAALVKFGLSGNTATAVLGTWVGSDEYRAFPYSLAPAYDGSGNANRLLLGLELGGSTLLSGTGYSEAYSTKPVNVTARFTYGIGAVALIDISNLKITASNAIGGDINGWQPDDASNKPKATYMSKSTGFIYVGGSVQSVNEKTCPWNFTDNANFPALTTPQSFAFVAKFESTLEWPTARG